MAVNSPVFTRAQQSRGVPTDYSIAAIPTQYGGRRYRSRLEARWASFFDQLGWRHEYEPFDLGAWSPDFGLPLSENWSPATWLLAEVKPIELLAGAPPVEILRKMTGALFERGTQDLTHLLFLGTAPVPDPERPDFAAIGIAGYPDPARGVGFQRALIAWFPADDSPTMAADIIHAADLHPSRPDGVIDFDFAAGLLSGRIMHQIDVSGYREHTLRLWARASNAVQYRAGGRS